jgi:hypothetical protein
MFQMITGEKELAKIGDNLYSNNFKINSKERETDNADWKRQKLASFIVLKAKKLAEKFNKKDISNALGYSHGGCKHLYNFDHLIEKDNYRTELLEIILKQLGYLEKKGNIADNYIYQSMVFRIERIFYSRYSGKKKEVSKKLKQLFGNYMGRLSQDIPKKPNEYNNELCIYKEKDKWYVDKVENYKKTSSVGETWSDYKKTLLSQEERKEIDEEIEKNKLLDLTSYEEKIKEEIEKTDKQIHELIQKKEQSKKDLESLNRTKLLIERLED